MIDVQRELDSRGMKAMMILQVHDELVFEAPEAETAELEKIVRAKMEGALSLKVPLKVDVGMGDNWLEVK